MRLSRAMVVVVLLFFSTPCTGDDRTQQGFDLGSMSYAGKDWGLVMDGAVKRGVAEGISGSISSFFKQIFGPVIQQGAHVFRICNKAIISNLVGQRGFDVREPVGYNHILKRDIETINNAAKGARVVRAHVLDKQQAGLEGGLSVGDDIKKKPYGVTVLKDDVEFIVNSLEKRLPYYRQKFTKKKGHVAQTLDWLALPGFVYMLRDWSVGANVLSAEALKDQALMRGEKLYLKQAEFSKAAMLEIKDGGWVACSTKQMERFVEIKDKRLELTNDVAEGKGGAVASSCVNPQLNKFLRCARYAAAAFVVWRSIMWVRSERAAVFAEVLTDVDRDMVVHIVHNVVDQLKHIVELCDEIKEDGDILRLKDDFEFTSKNCSEGLMHLAHLIDQEEAIKLQRLGKPGQSSAGLNQSGGGLGARFS